MAANDEVISRWLEDNLLDVANIVNGAFSDVRVEISDDLQFN